MGGLRFEPMCPALPNSSAIYYTLHDAERQFHVQVKVSSFKNNVLQLYFIHCTETTYTTIQEHYMNLAKNFLMLCSDKINVSIC